MNIYQFFLDDTKVGLNKNVHYFPIYERYLSAYVGRPLTLFELNDGARGSAAMWKRYLGPLARIVSLERDRERAATEDDQISVRFGEQSDTRFLADVLDEFGSPDIVIDDGSHRMSHIITAFETLYPRMVHNGVYLVEDVYTCYWEEYEGGFRTANSFIEYVKDLFDELHADHTRGRIPPTEFSSSTLALHIHDGIVVFERGRYVTRRSMLTGTTTGVSP